MSFIEDLIVAVVGGIISGIIVGLFLLGVSKINWKTVFFKTRIINIIKKYDEIKDDARTEKKYVIKFGQLLDNGYKKLEKMEFKIKPPNFDTIMDAHFQIHLTRNYLDSPIYQFYIMNLDNNEKYHSIRYKVGDIGRNVKVLNDFIDYFKKKK